MLEIGNLLIEMAVSAMFQGTWVTSFQESLSLNPPKSLADLFVKANKYIHHMKVIRTTTIDEDTERKRKERDVEEDCNRRQERARRLEDVRPQFNHHNCLTQPRFAILAAIKGSGLIKLLKMVDRPIGNNQDEYCRYHRTRGHSTNHCWKLKNQIEMLIQEGCLRRYT